MWVVFAARDFVVFNELSDSYPSPLPGTLSCFSNCNYGSQLFASGGRQMTGTLMSHLLDGVDIFLDFLLILLVATLIATFGEQIRMRP